MKNKIEFAVGAFLALALAALMVLAFASTNGKWSLGGGTYTIKAKFPNTGALRVNAPVKVGGVAIGAVSDIALDKNYDAVATLAIKDEYKLSADTSASILTSGLRARATSTCNRAAMQKICAMATNSLLRKALWI